LPLPYPPAGNLSQAGQNPGQPFPGALIESTDPQSPAQKAGFRRGQRIMSVDGQPLRDIIDWQWLTSGDSIKLLFCDKAGRQRMRSLERDPGEGWGFNFSETLFDGIKTCNNTCSFCFMRQLPLGLRPSLYLRDDDFRLSFLQGTFISCSNIDVQDESRIIEQRISPLRVSLHAISPQIREELLGRNAAKGLEVMGRLLDEDIEMHVQIVLVPGINDGEELRATLNWAYAQPNIIDVGIVPLGYTLHQQAFTRSYNEPDDALRIIEELLPFQERALGERNTPWVFAADEFYRNAYGSRLLMHLPKTEFYGDFELFEDGIGMIRSFVDSWLESSEAVSWLAAKLEKAAARVHLVIGCAQQEFLEPIIDASPLKGLLIPFPVRNSFFGGNVDVTGLLTASDILAALEEAAAGGTKPSLALLPMVIFNADGLTLDDMSLEDIQSATDIALDVVSCNPSDYLAEIAVLVAKRFSPRP